MPPDYQLKESEFNILKQWIAIGAPDSRTGEVMEKPTRIDIADGRKHWAFQPITNPPVPSVNNDDWPKNDIDRFILSRVETQELRSARTADHFTLLRRLYVDLTGLHHSDIRYRIDDRIQLQAWA